MKTLPDIPEWSKENYWTPEPFEWLYAFKDNKFVMLQLRDMIKEKAGAVGVKNFITKWNAFLQDKRKSEGVDIEMLPTSKGNRRSCIAESIPAMIAALHIWIIRAGKSSCADIPSCQSNA